MQNIAYTEAVGKYLADVLTPQLPLSSRQCDIVVQDVGARLQSLLARWNDHSFRSTILVTAIEEATFYQPDAYLDVKALVVQAIRNSRIEDYHATPHTLISDEHMKDILAAGVGYFAALDLEAVAKGAHSIGNKDPFGHLPVRYPNAWEVLSHMSDQAQTKYQPIVATAGTYLQLPRGPVGMRRPSIIVANGMDETIDPALAGLLRGIEVGHLDYFFVPCFKMLTRNIEKLYSVLDYVFHRKALFITANYLMAPGTVLQRIPLVRPPSFTGEVASLLLDPTGLLEVHHETLKQLALGWL
jgi:hypothetical protein